LIQHPLKKNGDQQKEGKVLGIKLAAKEQAELL
jgi:hypothetical protein